MKQKVLALSLLAMAAAAHAQSSVTLYGRIDNGLQYETGIPGGHAFSATTGNWGCSWWGLTGSEDLGGGTKAIFQLESQINTMNGSLEGPLFSRHATIGLTNDHYGTFKLGNLGAGEISQDSWGTDPQMMQRYGISSLVRGRNWASTSNGFEYQTPTWGGLQFRGQYSLTNNPNGWNQGVAGAQGRTNGIEGTYTFGMGDFRVIYDEVRSTDGTFDNVYAHSRSILAGGTLVFGPVRAYYGFQHLSAPDATLATTGNANNGTLAAGISGAPTSVNHEWIGAVWQASAATAISTGIYHANANNGNGNATLFTLGTTYNLSKRTFLYAEAAYIRNSSTSNLAMYDGGNWGAQNATDSSGNATNSNPQYGHSQTGVMIGMMTQF